MIRVDPYPTPIRGPGGAGAAAEECPPALCAALADAPAALLTRAGVQIVKSSRRTLVARVPWEGGDVACKRYLGAPWRRWVGLARARRAAGVAGALAAAGVRVARPLAWIEAAEAGWLVSRWIAGGAGADQRLAQGGTALREAAARSLAELIASIHAAGFVHRDLKAANLLLSADGGRAWLVDVDGCRSAARAPLARRVRDIQRLARALREGRSAGVPVLQRTDCVRFAERYSDVMSPAEREPLQRALLAALCDEATA